MMRLFIATPISLDVERELARIISLLKSAGGSVKWVEPSSIHLTLKFLGETDDNLIAQIKYIIDNVAASHKEAATALNSLGAFPNLSRPRVYWVDLRGGEQLSKIAAELDNCVFELGFEKENRPFRSHLTLGRVKFPKNLQKLNEAVENIRVNALPQIFDRIILFKSTLTPRGSIYEILHEALLGQ